jgi:hypothetical protein
MDDVSVRDLAMRETLGLLDQEETALLERLFANMTPDDQAAVLDLQAAVAREIGGAGVEEPDRALRYRVLARLAEESAVDAAASGPLATIGAARAARSGTPVMPRVGQVSELQFDRVSRSAAVWRAASFALGSAVLTLAALMFQTQANTRVVVDRSRDDVVTRELLDLVGDQAQISRFLHSGTGVVRSLTGVDSAIDGTAVLFREERASKNGDLPAIILALRLPTSVSAIQVVAVLEDGSQRELGQYDVAGRSAIAAIPLDLGGIELAGAVLELRDLGTGEVLMRTVTAV